MKPGVTYWRKYADQPHALWVFVTLDDSQRPPSLTKRGAPPGSRGNIWYVISGEAP